MHPQSDFQPMRWSMRKACAEFGRERLTIQKGLARTRAQPDAEGKYTVKQLAEAIHSNKDSLSQRAKNAQLEQQILALETAKLKYDRLESQLLRVAEVKDMWADLREKMRAMMLASDLSPSTKKRLDQEFSKMKLGKDKL
jgi:IS30 family transposase